LPARRDRQADKRITSTRESEKIPARDAMNAIKQDQSRFMHIPRGLLVVTGLPATKGELLLAAGYGPERPTSS
jgi:hypothetical protein